jgi:ABC-2 type transport system ATP-binding protein
MSTPLINLTEISKTYRFFRLEPTSLELTPGQIMGLVGPNGAGKTTIMRILMGLVRADAGEAQVLGRFMPEQAADAKRDIGFVSADMRLYPQATLDWHLRFMGGLYPGWDAPYAAQLLERFNLKRPQPVSSLSQGEHMKALMLLALARRPRLLVLDEPTTGLDPVARHEMLIELMDVLKDERRAILLSSHETRDVERICDRITFIDRGQVVDSRDKEQFLERWRRIQLDVPPGLTLPVPAGVVDVAGSGRVITVTSNDFSPDLTARYIQAGARVHEVQRMTLEEIFIANVCASRKEHKAS